MFEAFQPFNIWGGALNLNAGTGGQPPSCFHQLTSPSKVWQAVGESWEEALSFDNATGLCT